MAHCKLFRYIVKNLDGAGIRTQTNRVRVCGLAVSLLPNAPRIAVSMAARIAEIWSCQYRSFGRNLYFNKLAFEWISTKTARQKRSRRLSGDTPCTLRNLRGMPVWTSWLAAISDD